MENSNKNIFSQNKTKLLLLKKIKIKKFPEFQRNLNNFFGKLKNIFSQDTKTLKYKLEIIVTKN